MLPTSRQTRHELCWVRMPTTFSTTRARNPAVDLLGHEAEVDMLVQQAQQIAQTVEFRFTFLVGK